METSEIIEHTKRIIAKVNADFTVLGVYSEALELLRVYAGPKSQFTESLSSYAINKYPVDHLARVTLAILQSYVAHLESGLHKNISPERQAQLDVVSDFLEMANILLNNKNVHPAAPAVLIGATLEEFLRTWIEVSSLDLGGKKPGMETYSQVLREADFITKQDGKDITAWAGIRNHAAHGEWDEVADKNRVSLMMEGVNLFMRKYSE